MVVTAKDQTCTGSTKAGMAATATATYVAGERSPLLVTTASDDDYTDIMDTTDDYNYNDKDADATADKGASFQQTVVTLMKTCMGTGCLALPFAAQQGGIVLFCLGMVAIAVWNVYAVQRLVQCLQYVPNNNDHNRNSQAVAVAEAKVNFQAVHDEDPNSWHDLAEDQQPHNQKVNVHQLPPPPPGTSTLGMVAYYAFGPIGLQVLDIMMIILLLGIITAYFAAVISFLADTPLTVGPFFDATFTAIVMATISLVPNIGFLSHFSAIGLIVLLGAFLVIAGHGIVEQSNWSESSSDDDIIVEAAASSSSLALWPESIAGISSWFGCVIFSFGVPPLTYNFHSSMKEPDRLIPATLWGFSFVAVAYMIAGVGLYALYPNLTGEVLHELPHTGVLPTLTRLGMVTVVWMTAPLLIVPCGQLLEGKWQMEDNRVAVRFGICAVAVLVAVALPSFVQVLSFVGCACVGMVSFCVPPVLHLKLSLSSASKVDRTTSAAVLLDAFMLAWGVIATVISTYYSF
jgi:amino acid permease